MTPTTRASIAAIALACCTAHAAEQPSPAPTDLALSAGLRELLRAEMRELAQAMVTLAAAIPTADWQTVATTAERVRASYVLDRDMDAAQRVELARLPVEFRLQDEDFHDRARKLARDASTHDAEGATIQYARLLEACTRCHASFAQSRFPGFAPQD